MAKPEAKDDQVLVKVRAASVNALDYRRFEALTFSGRLLYEKIIKAVGKVLGAQAGQ